MMFSFLQMLRPKQWIKNLLLFFPPFFAGKIIESRVTGMMAPSLLAFSLAASSAYIINDIRDIKTDAQHDVKRHRPITRGDVSIPVAVSIAVLLYVVAFLIAASVSVRFEGFLAMYLLVSFLYTFFLKDVVLLDIFMISAGFLVRVLAGGEAFRVSVSNWMFLTVFIVSLFLAAGKRMGELVSLGQGAHAHRKTLVHYSQSFLEGVLWVSASAALVMYALYTLEQGDGLFYTVPLAAFGLLRYIYLVKKGKGDPTEALLKDRQILGVGISWLIIIAIMVYR